ncbi:hypothetical protein KGF57_002167 [Candida theae]|uniref:tRNA(Ile)-lysidine synthetase n=1 Tax=Candida theae TaxID=1198502 RepID=A0AAD5BFJ3_9ASCO|nr:uncharacterized protein KGF57_002167 [Candida theae]KAI5959229.1 hypothetical protein KGF57_002167 [Candida theae]
MWLLQRYKVSLRRDDIELHAITIDHNYRPDSASEARQLSQVMRQWNVHHIIEKLQYDVDPKTIVNFEEVARTKRYEAMNSICNTLGISVVVLGHHSDDQVETFVQRLQGNSSLFGLACTRKISKIPLIADLNPTEQSTLLPVKLVRPLLQYEKSTILSTCALNGIPYVIDPTNSDTKLTRRNYLRNLFGTVLPQIMDGSSSHDENSATPPVGFRSTQYQSIVKSELVKSQQQCADFAQKFELKAYTLFKQLVSQGKYSESPAFGTLELKLPKECLNGDNKVVTSRFLYQRLYPYSTLNHYHWAYAKLERSLLPRLEKLAQNPRSRVARFCIMNLIFEVTNNINSTELELDVWRAPLTRKELENVSLEVSVSSCWSQWHLFDKRFWMRFKSSGNKPITITVGSYIHKAHFPLVNKNLKEGIGKIAAINRLDSLPVIFLGGEIVAFPTLNIANTNVETVWTLKENKYDYVDSIIM